MSIRKKRKVITLTAVKSCKCSCRPHKGSDGQDYWVDISTNIVYKTDCHKKNPIRAKGIFNIMKFITVTQ